MKKTLKYLLIIIAIIIVVMMIIFVRRLIIINSLENNVMEYVHSTNSHVKMTYTNSINVSLDMYKLDNTVKQHVIYSEGQPNKQLIQITSKEKREVFTIDSDGNKVMNVYDRQNTGEDSLYIIPNFVDYTTDGSFIDKSHDAMVTKITSQEIDQIDCYLFSSLSSSQYVYHSNTIDFKVYINKETGLPVKLIETLQKDDGTTYESIINYQFKFGSVVEQDLTVLDNTEYMTE